MADDAKEPEHCAEDGEGCTSDSGGAGGDDGSPPEDPPPDEGDHSGDSGAGNDAPPPPPPPPDPATVNPGGQSSETGEGSGLTDVTAAVQRAQAAAETARFFREWGSSLQSLGFRADMSGSQSGLDMSGGTQWSLSGVSSTLSPNVYDPLLVEANVAADEAVQRVRDVAALGAVAEEAGQAAQVAQAMMTGELASLRATFNTTLNTTLDQLPDALAAFGVPELSTAVFDPAGNVISTTTTSGYAALRFGGLEAGLVDPTGAFGALPGGELVAAASDGFEFHGMGVPEVAPSAGGTLWNVPAGLSGFQTAPYATTVGTFVAPLPDGSWIEFDPVAGPGGYGVVARGGPDELAPPPANYGGIEATTIAAEALGPYDDIATPAGKERLLKQKGGGPGLDLVSVAGGRLLDRLDRDAEGTGTGTIELGTGATAFGGDVFGNVVQSSATPPGPKPDPRPDLDEEPNKSLQRDPLMERSTTMYQPARAPVQEPEGQPEDIYDEESPDVLSPAAQKIVEGDYMQRFVKENPALIEFLTSHPELTDATAGINRDILEFFGRHPGVFGTITEVSDVLSGPSFNPLSISSRFWWQSLNHGFVPTLQKDARDSLHVSSINPLPLDHIYLTVMRVAAAISADNDEEVGRSGVRAVELAAQLYGGAKGAQQPPHGVEPPPRPTTGDFGGVDPSAMADPYSHQAIPDPFALDVTAVETAGIGSRALERYRGSTGAVTEPSLPPGSTPVGKAEPPPNVSQATDQMRRWQSQMDSAAVAADQGYAVEHLEPTNPPGQPNPDYKIEGHVADNYCPSSAKSADGIAQVVVDKAGTQAGHIIVDLSDSNVDLARLHSSLSDWAATPGLTAPTEVWVRKGTWLIHFWP